MASPNIYERTGASSGARLATRSPIYMSGVVWYVGPGGHDAASPQGRERTYPLATLAQAYTNAAANDTIQFLENHVELVNSQLLNKAGLHLYGEGSGVTMPRLTFTGAAADMLDVRGPGTCIENIYFPQSLAAPTSRVRIAASAISLVNCRFDCGALDTAPAVILVNFSGQNHITDCRFTSTAIAASARPSIALEVQAAASDLELDTCVFDGGSYGWSDYAFKATAAITRLTGIDCDFLGGADLFTATGSSYRFHRRNATGAVDLVFTA